MPVHLRISDIMELKYINIKKCPQCGCSEVVNEIIETSGQQIRYHLNGKRWEQREFACGYAVRFDPNFNEMSEERHCRNSIREQEIQDKLKELIQGVEKSGQELGLCSSTITNMTRCVSRVDATMNLQSQNK